jgi:putative redox protein
MSTSTDRVSVKLRHSQALRFDVEVGDRRIELNSSNVMGEAFTPMELFLVALAGCTAMDVQWILERQRQKVDRFDMTVSGVRREEDPKYYETIDIRYSFAGQDLRKDAVVRAIRLSQEKYCSVRAMVNDCVKLKISYAIAVDGQPETVYTYVQSPESS